MKNFFASLLGSLMALVIFFGGCAFLGFLLVVALAAVGQKHPTAIAQGSYLVFDLSANIQDAPPAFDGGAFGPLFGGQRQTTLQLRMVTHAIRAAARDRRIAGLVIMGNLQPADFGSGYGALKEVRAALLAFKASGKPVVAFFNEATPRDYYLASVADELVLDPFGAILLPGLASRPLFMTGFFDKFGVGVQVTRVGRYKSAVEPYTRKDLSPEAREDLQKLLDDLWKDLLGDIATGRHVTRESLQQVVDAEGVIAASSALTHKLIDRTAYRDEIIDELKVKTGRRKGTTETFKQVSLSAYAGLPGGAGDGLGSGSNQIAVVYAEGEIVDGEGQLGEVGGRKFAREIRRLRQDNAIKAIVLRVNSPGGSGTASEEIQREIRLAMLTKPVVVSMGSVAASGGYYISTYSDRIFAEPTTITGSIGVFGLFFNVQQLANNLGFTFDTVKTGQVADIVSVTRPKTEAELAIFQKLVDWFYDEFTSKVAESRKLDRAKVLEIAQGRVWSGVEAKQLGLVDEIGGLGRAVTYAAEKAKLGSNYRLTEYPRRKQLAELINEMFRDMAPDQTGDNNALLKLVGDFKAQARMLMQFNDPRGIYARLPENIVIP
jgi:protease IV